MTVQLSLEPAFWLREVVPFDHVVDDLDGSEHVRLGGTHGSAARIEQSKSKYVYAVGYSWLSQIELSILTPPCVHSAVRPSAAPCSPFILSGCSSLLLDGLHWLKSYVVRYALWMDSARKVTVDDNSSILNLNCRVRNSSILTRMTGSSLTCRSTRFYSPVRRIHD